MKVPPFSRHFCFVWLVLDILHLFWPNLGTSKHLYNLEGSKMPSDDIPSIYPANSFIEQSWDFGNMHECTLERDLTGRPVNHSHKCDFSQVKMREHCQGLCCLREFRIGLSRLEFKMGAGWGMGVKVCLRLSASLVWRCWAMSGRHRKALWQRSAAGVMKRKCLHWWSCTLSQVPVHPTSDQGHGSICMRLLAAL